MTVVWDRLPRQHHNAPGIYYRVYYRRVGVEEELRVKLSVKHGKKSKNAANIGFYVVFLIPVFRWKFFDGVFFVGTHDFSGFSLEPKMVFRWKKIVVVFRWNYQNFSL